MFRSEARKHAAHLGFEGMTGPHLEGVGAPAGRVVGRGAPDARELARDGRDHGVEVVEHRRFPAELGPDRDDELLCAIHCLVERLFLDDASCGEQPLEGGF